MAAQRMLLLAVFGVTMLHSATAQTVGVADPNPAYTNSLRAEVMDTVLAIFNASGQSVDLTGPKFDSIVDILMNGSMPSDEQLLSMGIPVLDTPTTTVPPPPAVIPNMGGPMDQGFPPTDPNAVPGALPGSGSSIPSVPTSGGQQLPTFHGTNTGTLDPNMGTPNMGTFPNQPAPGTFPDLSQGTGGSIPVPPAPGSGAPAPGGSDPTNPLSGLFPNLPMPNTLPNPGPNSVSGPMPTNPLGGGGVPPINPFDPNAIGPKPFPTDMGSLGTPPGMFGPNVMGAGMNTNMPTTGILDAPVQQPQKRNNFMSNPLMWMMMMPEMMEGMFGGENSLMTMMLMQKLMRPKPRPRPRAPSAASMMDMVNRFNPAAGGGMTPPGPGGMDFLAGGGAGPMGAGGLPPPPQVGPGGAPPPGPSSLNELMNMMSTGSNPGGPAPTGTGQSSMDLFNSLTGTSPTGGAAPAGDPLAPAPNSGAPPAGGNPFDFFMGGGGTAGGAPAPGANDINALVNMINAGGAGTGPGPAPTDPFLSG